MAKEKSVKKQLECAAKIEREKIILQILFSVDLVDEVATTSYHTLTSGVRRKGKWKRGARAWMKELAHTERIRAGWMGYTVCLVFGRSCIKSFHILGGSRLLEPIRTFLCCVAPYCGDASSLAKELCTANQREEMRQD
jgi:hypothetical protein